MPHTKCIRLKIYEIMQTHKARIRIKHSTYTYKHSPIEIGLILTCVSEFFLFNNLLFYALFDCGHAGAPALIEQIEPKIYSL